MPAQPQPRNNHNNNSNSASTRKAPRGKPALAFDRDDRDPAQWLGFSLPPRSAPHNAGHPAGPPRRSKRGDAWRGSALTREKFVNASYHFVVKPTETLSYGAHLADPDIALHWPNILQILVPTFSSYSVAQGFVANEDEILEDDLEDDAGGESSATRRRRMEEERQGRSCPICLSKPVAGRMTKCGHIFCFPCIMHFIQLSDVPKSASCPICGDTIHEGMLKSVRYLDAETMVKAAQGNGSTVEDNKLGADATLNEAKMIDSEPATAGGAHRIHMRLLHRPQMTMLALPVSSTWPSDTIPPLMVPWHFVPDVLAYSRIMLASPEYMYAELNRELAELKNEWDLLNGDDLGRSFVKAAREKVERQIAKVTNELMTPAVRRNEADARHAWAEAVGGEQRAREKQLEGERRAMERAQQPTPQALPEDEVPVEFLAASDVTYEGPTVHVPPNVVVEPNPMPPTTTSKKSQKNRRRQGGAAPVAPPAPPAPAYYFYQSSLGANVFLHPLDSRILQAHFNTYSSFPRHISFTTTGYDSATVTDELRKRVKYLSHLAVGTEVVFVEADLSHIVSPEVLAQFEHPLKARRAKRRDRVRREDRDKRRAEQAERSKQPPEVHVIPSAQALDHDHELAMALAASRLDAGLSISPEVGAAFPLPSGTGPGTSPPAQTRQSSGGSFAWAVHSRATSSAPVASHNERLNLEGVEEAWSGLNLEGRDPEAEAEAPGGKKKNRKAGKKLVLGGAGRQA